LREIKILQLLDHENIVKLIEICTSKRTFILLSTFDNFHSYVVLFVEASAQNKHKSQFFLVFEFCEHDLAGLLSNTSVKFTLSEMKRIMQQLLNGNGLAIYDDPQRSESENSAMRTLSGSPHSLFVTS
jgi:cyclin-dependent kinase 9